MRAARNSTAARTALGGVDRREQRLDFGARRSARKREWTLPFPLEMQRAAFDTDFEDAGRTLLRVWGVGLRR